jgi:hypothetical protein
MILTPPERVLQPWEANPRELVSWLDMLQFSAYMFFYCGRALHQIKADCYLGAMVAIGDEAGLAMAQPLDEKAKEKAKKTLGHVEHQFRRIGLSITADTAKELADELEETSSMQSFLWLVSKVDSLENLADKELNGKFFLYIPPERAKFWVTVKKPHLFGADVAEKFPSASFDIANSGACLATMMSTAAVFHLMRVLEIGLSVLGKVFNVSLAHTNWGAAIPEIERKAREMHTDPAWKALPDCKEQQQFYLDAASQFGVLKDAWRNHTMHIRAKYTEDEAEMIYLSVRAFMQKLAKRLKEDETQP